MAVGSAAMATAGTSSSIDKSFQRRLISEFPVAGMVELGVGELDGCQCYMLAGVQSFTHPGLYCEILVSPDGLIAGCTCPYFLRLKRVCKCAKHILASARKYPDNLTLPVQNVFRFAPAHAFPDPEHIYAAAALDHPEAKCVGVVDQRRGQEILNDRVLASLDDSIRYARSADCDVKALELAAALLEHLKMQSPSPEAHPNVKRQRQRT